MAVTRIVVAEDDTSIRELLVHHLEREGFHCEEAADGPSALRLVRTGADVLILDLGLPVVDGFEVLRALRREGRELPILVLTARSEEIDRVVGLEIGADDYVVKPFSPREVVARVKALGRRAGLRSTQAPVVLTFERLEIDEAAREARIDGVDLGLKPREFALLLELAANAGVALSRESLLERVWGYEFDGDHRTVDVHVRRLRSKLEERAHLAPLLHTVHGFGYKFARA
ncbi:MAG: two-component system, OmpR family, response regulator ResD [Candidatus Eremiobacteraeota bacterium]|jgi:two-component system response regulator ResD|nr:two-component system, OmpR family, response regulator ResD [Candidatus Eremiobacteraeota bacterium]